MMISDRREDKDKKIYNRFYNFINKNLKIRLLLIIVKNKKKIMKNNKLIIIIIIIMLRKLVVSLLLHLRYHQEITNLIN